MHKPETCDIFCAVLDNYGDVGVSLRLARQLMHEHGIAVRLWVDDLASLRRLYPEGDLSITTEPHDIEIGHWIFPFPEVEPAQLVIETFSCRTPESYITSMALQTHKPVWINLEHLSAEDWVAGCHCLPSPHPSLPLTQYFFFPGFTPKTGGLLLERDLLSQREAFQQDPQAVQNFWGKLGIPHANNFEIRVSLFCYENFALQSLLLAWANSDTTILCLVPEGLVLPQVADFFGRAHVTPGEVLKQNNLTVQILPFLTQPHYDELLWACDLNFVRGEDSCVRAQWAARPFVWHIYPQEDNAHIKKLTAFVRLYCCGLSQNAAQALLGFWNVWNQLPNQPAVSIQSAWHNLWTHRKEIEQHAPAWAQQLSSNELSLNLLLFAEGRLEDCKTARNCKIARELEN